MAEDEDEPDYENVELQEQDDDNIYANVETKTTAPTAQDNDSQKTLQSVGPSGIRWNRRVGVGLLCAVLALIISIGVLLYLYLSNMVEKEQLTEGRDQLQASFDQMMTSHDNLTAQRDQLQTSFDQMKTSFDRLMRQRLCETPGWQKFGRGCYYVSNETKNWEESRLWCRDRLSDLIVINSKEEQDFVNGFKKAVWLGLTDRDREGSFQWVDGTPMNTPTYWQTSQPNGAESQNCVENYYESKPGWNDYQCSTSKKWICERVMY